MPHPRPELDFRKAMTPQVLVLALGFLIDAFDLLLYNMVRVPSLTELGLSGDALTKTGIFILNMQVGGMLAGGFFFGVLGDRIGRKRAVLGSILLYSLATLVCAFIRTPETYALWRFIAGFGLAGEIGLGLTLIAECLPKERRGLGAGIFSFAAFAGILLASVAAALLDWRTCYFIAGVAGLLLLFARAMILESGLYDAASKKSLHRGRLRDLLADRRRAPRFFACAFLLMPYFLTTQLLLTLAPEVGRALGIAEPVRADIALMISVACAMIADLAATLLSQHFRNRRKILAGFMACSFLSALLYLHLPRDSALAFYAIIPAMGLANFWVLITMSTVEQFGTNLRATASTAALNAGRGTIILTNLLFLWLKPQLGTIGAMTALCLALFALGALCLWTLDETFDRDMDFVET